MPLRGTLMGIMPPRGTLPGGCLLRVSCQGDAPRLSCPREVPAQGPARTVLPRSSPSTARRMSPETPTTAGGEPWVQDLAPGPSGTMERGDPISRGQPAGSRALRFHPCHSMGCERTAGDVQGASAPPAHPRGLLLARSIILRTQGVPGRGGGPGGSSGVGRGRGSTGTPGNPGSGDQARNQP